MTIYTCSRKRMVISKFSNRPPFELKTNESGVVSKNPEKYKKSLESINKSYNSIIKQLDNIELDQKQSTQSKANRNIIPKIIESFRRITPQREVIIVKNRNYLSSQDSSVQTIFRSKNSNFGKHIPNHKIMKNLLKNFGSGTKMYIEHDQVDTIPTRDTGGIRKCPEDCGKIKVDKTTSTSGIAWPVFLTNTQNNSTKKIRNIQSQIPHYCSNRNIDKTKSRIPKRKNAIRGVGKTLENEEKRLASTSSDSELNPNKKSTEKFPKHVRAREHTYIIVEETSKDQSETVKGLAKENSFVQQQVEKFNKLENKKQGRKKSSKTLDYQKRNWNLNNNYLDMMTSAKTGFPKIEEKFLEHTTTDNYDWSDTAYTKAEVKFPKETRHAMETSIQNARISDRTPLSRYLEHRNLDLRPAIPTCQGGRDAEENQRGPPYAKNVSFDKGDRDEMSPSMDKVSPCRCGDRPAKKHRPRRIPIRFRQ